MAGTTNISCPSIYAAVVKIDSGTLTAGSKGSVVMIMDCVRLSGRLNVTKLSRPGYSPSTGSICSVAGGKVFVIAPSGSNPATVMVTGTFVSV